MMEQTIGVRVADGEMPVELFAPEGAEGLPAVIVFIDAPGIRDELRDVCRRIAAAGFVCALPDLYYRIGLIRLDLGRRTETHGEIYRLLGGSLDNGAVAQETAALLDILSARPEVGGGRAGCLGFSVGGRFALQAPGLFPARVGVAATVCGTGLVTDRPDSPHLTVAGARNAAYLLEFAAEDPAVPESAYGVLENTFAAGGQEATITRIPGTGRGYTFALRPAYDAAAAEASWSRLLPLLERLRPQR